jgi:hypothetical protein
VCVLDRRDRAPDGVESNLRLRSPDGALPYGGPYHGPRALFGGFTPAVSTALIDMTGDKASPGLWMTFAAICGFFASLVVYRRGEASRNAIAAAA